MLDADLNGLITDLIGFAQAGKGLAVVGALIGLLVLGLRWGLGKKFAWFKTQMGGLVLVFGTALLASIGASLREGQGFSLSILLVALSAAWTATGIHTHVKDAVAALRKPKDPA